MKTVAPGGIATDFASRSLVLSMHPAYGEYIAKVMSAFRSPDRPGRGSTAEEIAEAVYEAATDQTDRVRFVAGEDAKANYAMRLENGVEAFRAYIRKGFMGR